MGYRDRQRGIAPGGSSFSPSARIEYAVGGIIHGDFLVPIVRNNMAKEVAQFRGVPAASRASCLDDPVSVHATSTFSRLQLP